jgi:hypothetical protein
MLLAQVDIGQSFFGGSHFLTNLIGLGTLVSILLSNAISIAGVLLLFLIVIGGISMVSGAGSGNPERVAQGRNIIAAGVIGFIIVVIAWWIVEIIKLSMGL